MSTLYGEDKHALGEVLTVDLVDEVIDLLRETEAVSPHWITFVATASATRPGLGPSLNI